MKEEKQKRRRFGLCGYEQSPVENSQVRNAKSSGSCGGSLKGCVKMGSIFSTSHDHQQDSRLEAQVAELEKEVEKQRELQAVYRNRMERTQDYLRYCLQIAQDNRFLHLIMGDHLHQSRALSANVSPPLPSPKHTACPELTSLIEQAKLHGWYIEPNEIELKEKIAEGTTATIFKATWRGLEVAVKCMNKEFFDSNYSAVAYFAQEVETLSRQRHKFVLSIMGACLEPPRHAWLVTELLGLTLKQWLHGPGQRNKERSVPVRPLEERLKQALEISQAMQYLHEQRPKVVHRDLKPSNILLDGEMHVRVADFGHARLLDNEEMALTGETGTYVYMAPEVIRCEPYDEKIDVYSFGIILNELITGEYPYIETDYGPAKIAMAVGEGKLRPKLPEDDELFGELIELVRLAWDEDVSIRPPFASITCTLRNIQNTLFHA